jgi:hypothetical protein
MTGVDDAVGGGVEEVGVGVGGGVEEVGVTVDVGVGVGVLGSHSISVFVNVIVGSTGPTEHAHTSMVWIPSKEPPTNTPLQLVYA